MFPIADCLLVSYLFFSLLFFNVIISFSPLFPHDAAYRTSLCLLNLQEISLSLLSLSCLLFYLLLFLVPLHPRRFGLRLQFAAFDCGVQTPGEFVFILRDDGI